MKLIKKLWIRFIAWLKQLFSKKVIADEPVIEKKKDKSVVYSNPITPIHNNRRNTKGRRTQYINVGEGRQRAIYHSYK